MTNEIWKTINGFNGLYMVSNLGRVKSMRGKNGWRILKPNKSVCGYMRVCLYFEQEKFYKYVHRLVAEAFIPNPNNLPHINHINEDKTDNAVENLEWTTPIDNLNYGTRTQRSVATRLYNIEHPQQYYNRKIASMKKKIKAAKLRMSNYIVRLERQLQNYQERLDAINTKPNSQYAEDDNIELCY